MVKKRKRTRVEYRYFPATARTGILGGIVAGSMEAAHSWGVQELYAKDPDFKLVRVRMEYEPLKARKRSESEDEHHV